VADLLQFSQRDLVLFRPDILLYTTTVIPTQAPFIGFSLFTTIITVTKCGEYYAALIYITFFVSKKLSKLWMDRSTPCFEESE
jgi:hypothetical protein